MYGLSQAGILANKLLKLCLACHGYFEQPHMPGLWKHASQPIWFNLCVDDFGIKYIGDEHLKHLFAALLSWQCWQHVGNMLATCQKVAKFGSTCMLVPTQKVPRHKNFASEITNKL
jgi:hypothetical protein